MRDPDIDAFFEWFAANAAALTHASQDPAIVAKLNERVDRLNPDLAWEIGPGIKAEWFFALSPDGEDSLSESVRYVISRAPEVPRWEFHAFRQPRNARPVVELETPRGPIEIDANDAEYVLLRARDGTYDMLISLPVASQLHDRERRTLAVLLLDGLIGEEPRMSLIRNVEFVEGFGPKYQGRTTKIRHLRGHLDQQLKHERGSRSRQ